MQSYKNVSTTQSYKELSTNALSILVPFATTYLYEFGLSSLLHLENKYRNRLNLSNDLRVALSNCVLRYERMISAKQQQKSLGLFLMTTKVWKLNSTLSIFCFSITRRIFKNEDTAKSNCFCDFCAFF